MTRKAALLCLALALGGGAGAYGLLRGDATAEATAAPEDAACTTCDARHKSKLRLREALAAQEKAED